MWNHSVAVGIVEQKGWVAAAVRMAMRATWMTSVDICISGVKATSLCSGQALFCLGVALVHSDMKRYRAGMMVAPSDAAQWQTWPVDCREEHDARLVQMVEKSCSPRSSSPSLVWGAAARVSIFYGPEDTNVNIFWVRELTVLSYFWNIEIHDEKLKSPISSKTKLSPYIFLHWRLMKYCKMHFFI